MTRRAIHYDQKTYLALRFTNWPLHPMAFESILLISEMGLVILDASQSIAVRTTFYADSPAPLPSSSQANLYEFRTRVRWIKRATAFHKLIDNLPGSEEPALDIRI